jgi:YHS domain-containing protein
LKHREVNAIVKDHICGMDIDEKKAGASYEYLGFTYYFCSSACRDKFAEATIPGINPQGVDYHFRPQLLNERESVGSIINERDNPDGLSLLFSKNPIYPLQERQGLE